ncbi:MAG: C39 family peptidase [bacterium]|nr:C39 family peptidase [bacterium]
MSYIHERVPYFSQWESRELVGKIIRKEDSAKADPLWKNSGAETPEEYELWSWNGCGMACLKMILARHVGKEFNLVGLGRLCMQYGGYKQSRDTLNGLYYKPFVDFIGKEFNLVGRVASPLSLGEAIDEVNKKNYVIASVSHEIRRPAASPTQRGGHLILILGFDANQKTLFIHNPSGDTKESQEYARVSFMDFEKFFAHRGIIIETKGFTEDN